jgi:hypothetical protein
MLLLPLTEASEESGKGCRVGGSGGACDVPEAWYLLESMGLDLIAEIAAPEKVA